MKTSIKMILEKAATIFIGLFIGIFGLGSSVVIFMRSIEIIQNMYYTSGERFAILGFIGLALIWLTVLAIHSAEHIIKASIK